MPLMSYHTLFFSHTHALINRTDLNVNGSYVDSRNNPSVLGYHLNTIDLKRMMETLAAWINAKMISQSLVNMKI